MAETVPSCSPSGLFRKAAWSREIEERYERMPRWGGCEAGRDREFLLWVEAEAGALAVHLFRLLRDDLPAETGAPLKVLLARLMEDIGWARRLLEETKARVERAA